MPGVPAGMMNVPGQTNQSYPGQMPQMAQQPPAVSTYLRQGIFPNRYFNALTIFCNLKIKFHK